MNETADKNMEEIEQKIEELEQEFKDLTQAQKELLLYKKIMELGKAEENSNEVESQDTNLVGLFSLTKAADISFLNSLILYTTLDQNLKKPELYQESFLCYNHILETYKKLAQDLKIHSALDLSHFLTYLLWNGYFSVKKKHFYQVQERLLLPGMYSFDVIKGKGVCLSYAELLKNYLSICEKDSALLICKVPTKKNKIHSDYLPEIERNIKNNIRSEIVNGFTTFFLGRFLGKFGNHAVTLIEENEKMYAYDLTNLFALNIKDDSTLSIINGKGEFQIKYLMTFVLNSDFDSNPIFEKIVLGAIEPAFSRKEFIFSFENLMERVKENIGLLDDAYATIHSDLEYIDKETDEVKKYSKKIKRF